MHGPKVNYLPRTIDLLVCEASKLHGVEEAAFKISLGSLICWREETVFRDHVDPGVNLINTEDDRWTKRMLVSPPRGKASEIAFCFGFGDPGNPIDASLKRLKSDPEISDVLSRFDEGGNEKTLREILDDRSLMVNASTLKKKAGRESAAIGRTILRGAFCEMDRKSIMRQLNAMILLEEAGLISLSPGGTPEGRRKLAIDYSLMRLLGQISVFPDKGIDEITQVFRNIGRTARLNNAISDGLDRVRAYAAETARDSDKLEAGRASGRPVIDDMVSLRTAAQQCRLFRDRILV